MDKDMGKRLVKGSCLVASPHLRDPHFCQTVVLLCEHGRGGSLGLVVNRRTDQRIMDILPEAAGLHERAGLVYRGGPVQKDNLLILHRLSGEVPDSHPVFDGVRLSGDIGVLQKVSDEGGPGDLIRAFLGYVGWGPGQLQSEVARGSWFVLPADLKVIFTRDPHQVWRAILRALGGAYTLYATMPPDPSLN